MNRPVSLCDLLEAGAVWSGFEADTKKQLLQDMARHAASFLVSKSMFFSMFCGKGKSLAPRRRAWLRPSARAGFRLAGCAWVFARLSSPIAYEAVDERPVDLVFMLLAPETAGADHLHALAAVSALFAILFCASNCGG
jgi:PTS system nitrogen regulatory IIA component